MKELSLEEVLQIAGGRPLTSSLDEVTYRTAEPSPGSVDRDLLGNAPSPTRTE